MANQFYFVTEFGTGKSSAQFVYNLPHTLCLYPDQSFIRVITCQLEGKIPFCIPPETCILVEKREGEKEKFEIPFGRDYTGGINNLISAIKESTRNLIEIKKENSGNSYHIISKPPAVQFSSFISSIFGLATNKWYTREELKTRRIVPNLYASFTSFLLCCTETEPNFVSNQSEHSALAILYPEVQDDGQIIHHKAGFDSLGPCFFKTEQRITRLNFLLHSLPFTEISCNETGEYRLKICFEIVQKPG